VTQLGVAALDKGWPLPAPAGSALGVRLDLSHACSPECINIYGPVSKAWIEYGSGLLMQQHAVGMAADEDSFTEALGELNDLLDRLRTPLQQGLFGGDHPYCLVDAAYAPFFMRMEIQAAVRPEITAAVAPSVAAWSGQLLTRPSLKRSVVEDFTARYFRFLQQKGSWLANQPRTPD
jgi:glutathione S-transferase